MIKNLIINFLNNFGFFRIRQIENNYLREFNDFKKHFIINYSPTEHLLEIFFENLKLSGFVPKLMFDIGAHGGSWTQTFLKYFNNCECHMFEPQKSLISQSKDLIKLSNVKMHNIGISRESGHQNFTYVERADSCTFAINDKDASRLGYKQQKLEVKSLNDFIDENNLPTPEIVKIDAEGLDLEILKGSTNLLGKTEVFLVECAIGDQDSDNSIHNIFNFMSAHNYRLFEITDIIRSHGNVTWLSEVVFILKGSAIDRYQFAKK